MKIKIRIVIFNIIVLFTLPACYPTCCGLNAHSTGPKYLSNPVMDNNGNIHLSYIFQDTRGFYPFSFSHITFKGNNTFFLDEIDSTSNVHWFLAVLSSFSIDIRDIEGIMFSINGSMMNAGLWFNNYGGVYVAIYNYEEGGWKYEGEIRPSCEITSAEIIPSSSTNYLFYTQKCEEYIIGYYNQKITETYKYGITATVLDLSEKDNSGFKKLKEWSWDDCTFSLTSRILESKNFYALVCKRAIISYNYNKDRWNVMEMKKFPEIMIRTYQKGNHPYIVSASLFEDFEGNPALLDSSGYYQESYSSPVSSSSNAVIYHFTSGLTWYIEKTPIPAGAGTIIFDTYVQDNIFYAIVYLPSKGYEYFTYDGAGWKEIPIPYNMGNETPALYHYAEFIEISPSSSDDEVYLIPRTIVDKYGNFHVFMFEEYSPDHYKRVDEECGTFWYTFIRGFHEWYDGIQWNEQSFGEVEE